MLQVIQLIGTEGMMKSKLSPWREKGLLIAARYLLAGT